MSSSSSSPSNSSSDSSSPAESVDLKYSESSQDNLIETLKKSLKLTDNKFLESEIEDLKEFFTVELLPIEESDGSVFSVEAKKLFWLKVYLPVTLKTDEGKFVNEKPLISFKIELKKEIKPHDPDNEMCLPYLITDFKLNFNESLENEEEESFFSDESKLSTSHPNPKVSLSSSSSRLSSILSNLLASNEISLLTLIEDVYIKLEEFNYPEKEIICRDFYYPIFDCRHWGRSNFIKTSNSSSNLFNLLSNNNNKNNNNNNSSSANNNNSSTSNLSYSSNTNYCNISFTASSSASPNQVSNVSVMYRARALYDFQALMQGELSFKENEILLVLANLGNGWLTARRVTSSTSSLNVNGNTMVLDSDDLMIGLIPENYIERL